MLYCSVRPIPMINQQNNRKMWTKVNQFKLGYQKEFAYETVDSMG